MPGSGICEYLENGICKAPESAYTPVEGHYDPSSDNIFAQGIKIVLGWILSFFGWILSIAAAIFGYAADAQNLTKVINSPVIYDTWKIVRDLLNMAFIIVLVYVAFTIIFQVDSSNKKIILTIVLMALLVNFSFPIARFIIDVGNSLMYTIFQNLFKGMTDPSQIYASFADSAALGKIINGTQTGGDPAQLIAAIIFTAILAITFLIMSILFVIRIIALAIIIIFSPIAFVGAAIPSFSSKSRQWWDYLFKYTFFGPAMALMIYIALRIANATISITNDATAKLNMEKIADTGQFNLIQSMSTFAIPIVVLWIGMGVAQRMGIEGAAMVTKKGQGVLAWAGKKFSGYNSAKRQVDVFNAQRKKSEDEKAKNRFGGNVGQFMNRAQDTVVGTIPIVGADAKKRAEKMRRDEHRKDVEDKAKEIKDSGATIEAMSVEINNSFDAAGTIGPNVTKDQASNAKAFVEKNADDKKSFVEDALNTKGGTKAPGLAGSGLEKVLAGAPINIQQAMTVIAGLPPLPPPAPTPPGLQDALRQVTSYINRRAEDVVQQYTR